MNIAETLLAIYASAGFVFGIAFVTTGIARLDPAAKGSSWGFRVIILPGVAALWPWLLTRWVRA
jgi:hypothetical protein